MLLALSASGLSKRTPLADYPVKGRATGGVAASGFGPKDALLGVAVVEGRDEVLVWTEEEESLRIPAKTIPTQGRDRKGTRLPGLPKEARVVGVARPGE